jgi:ribosome-associated toxin RatA of RatAB toxin-antitoxin module
MAMIQRSALVGFSAGQMFSLVNDVDSYAHFLPWCRSSRILSSSEDEMRAEIEIAHGALQRSFTTRNLLQSNKMIEMRLEQGPFRHLNGFWRFESLTDGACRVSLDLDFEFSNRLIGLAMGPIFSQIANSLVDSFCRRAEIIYGKGGGNG